DGIGEVSWSPDGRHLAYVAERRGAWTVVRDGRPGAWHDGIKARSIHWSAGGTHLGYVGEDRGHVLPVIDGVPGRPYEAIAGLEVRDDGGALYAARRGGVSYVIDRGREIGPYEDVAEVSLAPGGARAAWTARLDGAWRVVAGEATSEGYDRVAPIVW